MSSYRDRQGDRLVLMLIGGGIVAIILAILACLAFARGMPEWAEGVMNAIVGGALVKLADVLSALVALSSNRQIERVTDQLSASTPPGPIEARVVNSEEEAVPVEPRP